MQGQDSKSFIDVLHLKYTNESNCHTFFTTDRWNSNWLLNYPNLFGEFHIVERKKKEMVIINVLLKITTGFGFKIKNILFFFNESKELMNPSMSN